MTWDPIQTQDDEHYPKTSTCLPNYPLDLQKRSVANLSQNQANKVHDLLVEFQDGFCSR